MQKLEGNDTRDLEKMLETAWKVYNNKEKEAIKKQQASMLAVLQQVSQVNIREFRIDTGASFSAINEQIGPLSDSVVSVVGVSEEVVERSFLRPLEIKFGNKELDHQFLYMPSSPECLLGRGVQN